MKFTSIKPAMHKKVPKKPHTVHKTQIRRARAAKKAPTDEVDAPTIKNTKKNAVKAGDFMTSASITTQTPSLPKSLQLKIDITDPDVIQYFHDMGLNKKQEEVDELVHTAVKIGVMALKNAQTKVDVQTIHNEVDRMLAGMNTQLESHNQLIHESINAKLKEYFDPTSGRFEERIRRLIHQDGELTNIMKQQIINTSSTLVRELTPLIGPGSRLLTALDPDSKQSVVGAIQWAVGEVCNESNKRILSEFSLDNGSSSLVRLVNELRKLHEENNQGTQNYLKELSLDHQNSALNRLIRTIDQTQRESQNLLSLDVKNSSMNRLRSEIIERIEAQNQQITNMEQFLVRELSIANTQQNMYQKLSKQTPLHGLQFEQQLFQFVSQLVNGSQPSVIGANGKRAENAPISSFSASDHLVESCGNRVGKIRSCKVGDVLITMGPEHVSAGSKIVIEAKNDFSYNLQKALDEISVARKNRDAQCGIFVFGKGSQPDNMENLKRYNNDIVVVWDPEDPVTNVYLDAAISISKALLVRRQISTNENNTSKAALNKHLMKIKDLVGHIEQEMQVYDEIRKYAETSYSASEKILAKCKTRGKRAMGLVEELNHEVLSAQTISNLLEHMSVPVDSASSGDGETNVM